MTTAVAVGIQQRTLADKKASSGIRLRMMADAFGLPDKEEVPGSSPGRPTSANTLITQDPPYGHAVSVRREVRVPLRRGERLMAEQRQHVGRHDPCNSRLPLSDSSCRLLLDQMCTVWSCHAS